MKRTTFTVVVEVTCSRCEAEDWRDFEGATDVAGIADDLHIELANDGWEFGETEDLCPTCSGAADG